MFIQLFLIVDSGPLDRLYVIFFPGVGGPVYKTNSVLYILGWTDLGVEGGGFVGNYCPQTKWTLSIDSSDRLHM